MRAITELDEMKKIQLEIMDKIHSFCVENSITYFLSHGSLLGAVRHKGFIPWDDDIDIFMRRPDYARFCEQFQVASNKYGLELVNNMTPRYYGRPMSKVVDTRTILFEPNYIGDDPIGVNVDIWPLDGVPAIERTKCKHRWYLKLLQGVLYGRILKLSACVSYKEKIIHVLLLPISHRCIVNRIQNTLKKYKYDSSPEVSCYVDPYKKVFLKEWFDEAVLAGFEQRKYYIPSGASNILAELYGDYMKLPPVDKQKPHHITNAFWK